MIESQLGLSIRRQCVLLNVPRGRWYAPAAVESAEDLEFKRLLDEEYLRHPFYGSRRMTAYLRSLGWAVNRKRVRRLLREMGLTAVGPKPNTSRRDKVHGEGSSLESSNAYVGQSVSDNEVPDAIEWRSRSGQKKPSTGHACGGLFSAW